MPFIRRIGLLCGFITLLMLWAVHPALADSHVIYVDTDASGADDGTSWADAYPTLQDALAVATDGDQIWVAEGVYYPDEFGLTDGNNPDATFQLVTGVEVFGGFAGTETALEERSPKVNVTVLSGDIDQNDTNKDIDGVVTDTADILGNNAYHVVTGSGTDATTLLDGFTITAGSATASAPNNAGAGVLNNAGSPTLNEITFSANLASGGGAIFNVSSSPILTNVNFFNNTVTLFGGGMYNADDSHPTVTDTTFLGNTADQGAGVYNSLNSSLTLTDVVFIGNEAIDIGGGIFAESNSDLTISGAAFGDNSADFGGGIFISGGSLTIDNALFSGNTAATTGGGIFNSNTTAILTNMTLYANDATSNVGGGIYNFSGDVSISNSIFWSNTAGSAGSESMYNDQSNTIVTHTLIDATTVDNFNGGSWTSGGEGNIVSGDDPLFVDADGFDGFAGTADDNLRLTASSPAVDTGDNDQAPATDIAGISRPVDGDDNGSVIADMGAYEYYVGTFYVDKDATGAGTGLSWADAFTTLQDALLAATSGSEVWVAEGVYYPDEGGGRTPNARNSVFAPYAGVAVYGGFAGTETQRSERDPAANITVLSGDIDGNDATNPDGIVTDPISINGLNAYHVVALAYPGDPVTLDGFTVTAGKADGAGINGIAGGIFNYIDLNLANMTIIGNLADAAAGVFGDTGGSSTLNNVLITANFAENAGGMFAQGHDVEATNVTFFANEATTQFGGFGANNGSTISLTNVVFDANTAGSDAGAFGQNGGTFTLTNVTFYNNSADQGGAVFNFSANGTVHNSIFWNNTATTAGNAIFNDEATASTTVTYSLIDPADVENNLGDWTNGDGNITDGSNPLFTDAANGDLTLQLSSPAVNAGDNSVVPVDVTLDLAGNPRIDSGTVDMGAYETQLPPDGDPTNVEALYIAEPHEVELTWTDNTTNEDGYIIERKKDAATDWYVLTTTAADATSYTDDTVTCDQDYVYRVTATNAADDSAAVESNVVSTECDIFVDVPSPDQPPAWEPWIEDFYQAGITTGCNEGDEGVDLRFCPTTEVNRGQMAVFILRALAYPAEYTPTGIDPNPFDDVPSPNLPPNFENWIEDFLSLGITTGCNPAGNLFCPEVAVDRGQMAVFILRAIEGDDYVPVDDPDDPFVDVPSPNQPPAWEPWIEDFYNRGITTGCNNGAEGVDLRFCPETTVDRGQMALFILRAFDSIADPDTP